MVMRWDAVKRNIMLYSSVGVITAGFLNCWSCQKIISDPNNCDHHCRPKLDPKQSSTARVDRWVPDPNIGNGHTTEDTRTATVASEDWRRAWEAAWVHCWHQQHQSWSGSLEKYPRWVWVLSVNSFKVLPVFRSMRGVCLKQNIARLCARVCRSCLAIPG